MPIELDGILLSVLLADGEHEPEIRRFDETIEELVPLVCAFFQQKLSERGYARLSVVWPDQGKTMSRWENSIE